MTFETASIIAGRCSMIMDNGAAPTVSLYMYCKSKFDTIGISPTLTAVIVPMGCNFNPLENHLSDGNIDGTTLHGNKTVASPAQWLCHNTTGHHIPTDSKPKPHNSTKASINDGFIIANNWFNIPFSNTMKEILFNLSTAYFGIYLIHSFDLDDEFAHNAYFNNNTVSRCIYQMYSPNKAGYEPYIRISYNAPIMYPAVNTITDSIKANEIWRVNGSSLGKKSKFYGLCPIPDKTRQNVGGAGQPFEMINLDIERQRYMAGGYNRPGSPSIDGLGESVNINAGNFVDYGDRAPWNRFRLPAATYELDIKKSIENNYVLNNSGSGLPIANQCWQVQEGTQATSSNNTGPSSGPGNRAYLVCETSSVGSVVVDPWGGPGVSLIEPYRNAVTQGSEWKLQTEDFPIFLYEDEPEISVQCHFYGDDIETVQFRWQFAGMGNVWLNFNTMHIEGNTSRLSATSTFHGPQSSGYTSGADDAIDTHWTANNSPWLKIRLDRGSVISYTSDMWGNVQQDNFRGKRVAIQILMTVNDIGNTATQYLADAAITDLLVTGLIEDRTVG